MRIVAGKWKGRDLVSPAGPVRPTTEELRAAWLTRVEPALPGARVLELFAGSGALGIEAISRGARYADFVEYHPSALHALKANVAAFRLKDKVRVFKQDAIAFARRLREGQYDVAFADPPYDLGIAEAIAERWLAVPFAGVLGVEHRRTQRMPGDGERRQYGQTAITFYRRD